jgi:hypothetical protein
VTPEQTLANDRQRMADVEAAASYGELDVREDQSRSVSQKSRKRR